MWFKALNDFSMFLTVFQSCASGEISLVRFKMEGPLHVCSHYCM